MATTATPGSPASQTGGFRRTSNTRYQRQSLPATDEPEEDAEENLFVHPDAKIYSFPAPDLLTRGSKDGGPLNLSWTAWNEKLEAAGSLRLYRHHGGASFLSSGRFMLTLLPKSQCWCVDRLSKFAIHTKMMIYRIELPYSTEEEKSNVEDLKRVLNEIIMYEKTRCPFKRGFEAEELPERDSISPKQTKLLGRTKRIISSPGRGTVERTLSSADIEQSNQAANLEEVEEDEDLVDSRDDRPITDHTLMTSDDASEEDDEPETPLDPPPQEAAKASPTLNSNAEGLQPPQAEASPYQLEPVGEGDSRPLAEVQEGSASSGELVETPSEDDEEEGQTISSRTRDLYVVPAVTPSDPPSMTSHVSPDASAPQLDLQDVPHPAPISQLTEATTHAEEPDVERTTKTSLTDTALFEEPDTPTSTPVPLSSTYSRQSAIRSQPTGIFSRILAILTGPSSDFFSIIKELASRVVTGLLSNATSGGYMIELVSRDRLPGKWIDSTEDLSQIRYSEDTGGRSDDEGKGSKDDEDDEDLDEWMEEEDDYGVKLGNGKTQTRKRGKWERELGDVD